MAMNGLFLLVDKPPGMTSHDVVDRVREVTDERRVGHGGTLDPLATGLLIVGVGREATRELGRIARGSTKTYTAEIVLGEERETDDSEGRVAVRAKGVLPPAAVEIERTLRGFLGEQEQVPPKYSAVRVSGERAYRLARKGKKVVLKQRKVFIHRIKLLRYKYPRLEIEAKVSAGTYIRALARDIGRRLGCGAYLHGLRRTRIGRFSVDDAVSLARLTRENFMSFVLPISSITIPE